jgi:cytidine deaminase
MNRSYAPYSRCYAGVCITFTNGTTASGSYVENVAFNPSLPPLQGAIIAHLVHGGLPDLAADKRAHLSTIASVVLVEQKIEDGLSFAPATRAALASLAPTASFEHIVLEP